MIVVRGGSDNGYGRAADELLDTNEQGCDRRPEVATEDKKSRQMGPSGEVDRLKRVFLIGKSGIGDQDGLRLRDKGGCVPRGSRTGEVGGGERCRYEESLRKETYG